MTRSLLFLVPAAALFLPQAAELPAELLGRVQLALGTGERVPAEGAVVWVPGVSGASGGSGTPSITQRDKRFVPHVVAVQRGEAVSFPNVDPIFHNVFSVSTGNEFDLGLFRKGASRSVRFRSAGLVRVYCNIHPEMAAYVRVLDETAFAVTSADGSFRISGVPRGARVVRLWHEKGGEKEIEVELVGGRARTMNAVLDASGYRDEPHKNKYGLDYPVVKKNVNRY